MKLLGKPNFETQVSATTSPPKNVRLGHSIMQPRIAQRHVKLPQAAPCWRKPSSPHWATRRPPFFTPCV